MNAGEVLACAAGVSTAALAIGGCVFKLGQHSQRLADAECDIRELKEKAKEHGGKLEVVGRLEDRMLGIEGQLREVAHDIKNLLLGRIMPARRRPPDD